MNPIDFHALYDTWYKKSFAFAKSYVQDDMIAEDIVSESIVKLWKLMQEKEIEHPQGFLLTLLKNKTLDYLKRETVRKVAEEELAESYNHEMQLRISTLEACNPEEMFLTEIKEIIAQTLNSLPEQTRIIFEMSRYDGLPVKEIAKRNGITPKAVEYHITRSLKVLRKNLKDYLPFVIFLFG
jgi:RNA polymerase sigma-70 factor (ECF subfamily)